MPSINMIAKACCHDSPIAWQRVKAKKAFKPMLGACAKGNFAINANSKVAMADAMAVLVNSASRLIPVVERMSGFTAKM